MGEIEKISPDAVKLDFALILWRRRIKSDFIT